MRPFSDWLPKCCCEPSVYADMSKQRLMKSSSAGRPERFWAACSNDGITSWTAVVLRVLGWLQPCNVNVGNLCWLVVCHDRNSRLSTTFLWLVSLFGRGVGVGGIRLCESVGQMNTHDFTLRLSWKLLFYVTRCSRLVEFWRIAKELCADQRLFQWFKDEDECFGSFRQHYVLTWSKSKQMSVLP